MKRVLCFVGITMSLLAACTSSTDPLLDNNLLDDIRSVCISKSSTFSNTSAQKPFKKLTNKKDIDSFKQILKKAHRVQHSMDKTDYDVLLLFKTNDAKGGSRLLEMNETDDNGYFIRLVGDDTETFEVDAKDASAFREGL
ncbi:hypothetical protein A374_17984 [Fictibacillus macauensis ZFHKF-1]|uniref:Lipoprotein n=1 Tax=Fictibacillus macauensis ZFHKF-1 TaxID=1196324 RepID=I8UAL6_9BACL|nr:hypothetical protein [Fictibacillus macauensis]EIT83950.1 hypothetical protein A374_17984 [Fictibacillus macauensis ZFHKF-1]